MACGTSDGCGEPRWAIEMNAVRANPTRSRENVACKIARRRWRHRIAVAAMTLLGAECANLDGAIKMRRACRVTHFTRIGRVIARRFTMTALTPRPRRRALAPGGLRVAPISQAQRITVAIYVFAALGCRNIARWSQTPPTGETARRQPMKRNFCWRIVDLTPTPHMAVVAPLCRDHMAVDTRHHRSVRAMGPSCGHRAMTRIAGRRALGMTSSTRRRMARTRHGARGPAIEIFTMARRTKRKVPNARAQFGAVKLVTRGILNPCPMNAAVRITDITLRDPGGQHRKQFGAARMRRARWRLTQHR